MIILKTILELAFIGLLLYGFCYEKEIIRFEQMIFSKRGRAILKKNLKEGLK